MSLQTSTSRLIQRQLRQLASVKPVAGPSSCLCICSTASSWASRSRWQSTRSQSTSTAGSNLEEHVQSPEDHDIVIVGGGLVGLALANALCMSDRTLVSFFIRTSPSLRCTLVRVHPLGTRTFHYSQLHLASFNLQARKSRFWKAAILTKLRIGLCRLENGRIEYRVLRTRVSAF